MRFLQRERQPQCEPQGDSSRLCARLSRLVAPLALSLLLATGALTAADKLTWVISGGVTHERARVTCQTVSSSSNVVLVVSRNADLSNPTYTSSAKSTDGNRVVRFDTGSVLTADATYYYGIRVNGSLESQLNDADNGSNPYTGRFNTLPAPGSAKSFKVVFGSCLEPLGGGNDSMFNTMKNENPLFWMCTGDFHYGNIGSYDPSAFRSRIIDRFYYNSASTNLASLSRRAPFAYVWDDHDFGPNNSTGGGKTGNTHKKAAHQVYRQLMPHHDLPMTGTSGLSSGEEPICQAWTVGRVRFIMADLRTESTGSGSSGSGTLFGPDQKEWFKREMLAANGRHQAIVWITSVPWNGGPTSQSGEDKWEYAYNERREIANFLHNQDITGLVALAGDMHGTAIDSGPNTIFTSGNVGSGFKMFQAGPFQKGGSYKGGPYDIGANDQLTSAYGLLDFVASSSATELTMTAKNSSGSTVIASRDNPGNPITHYVRWSQPVLLSNSPANGATNVANTTNLVLNFNENVFASTGTLTIRRTSDGSVVRTINGGDAAVSISGTQVTINLSNLPEATELGVSIGTNFLKDGANNPNPAMQHGVVRSGVTFYPWTFTTAGDINSPPAASFTMTPESGNLPLAVSFDASASSDPDGDSLSYSWNFGDGTSGSGVTTSHTYSSAGSFTVTLTVNDGNNAPVTTSKTVTVIDPNGGSASSQPQGSNDDAEEWVNGTIDLTSTDLELVRDDGGDGTRGNQTVGIRFPGLAVPAGVIITAASITFTVDEAFSEATNLTLRAELSTNAAAFGSTSGNISNRALTSASVSWSPSAWSTAGQQQVSPDLSALIQEVINQPGWSAGNAVVVVVTGTGRRTAESYDGSAAAAPVLNVDFTAGDGGPGPGPGPGTIYEAEATDGTVTRLDGVYIDPEATASGGAVANYPNSGGSVNWTIDVATSGWYAVSFGYSLMSGDRPLRLLVDGNEINPALSFPATGDWGVFAETGATFVNLGSGSHTVSLDATNLVGANIDYLLIRSALYEAEATDGTVVRDGGVYIDPALAASGGEVANYPASGGSVTWTVDVAQAGQYSLAFGYSLSSGDRPLRLLVDGSEVNPSLSFPSTGGWNTFSETAATTVSWTAGTHNVALDATNLVGANIDYLVVTTASGSRTILIGIGPGGPPWLITDPPDAPNGTADGDDTRFDGLDPDQDHTLVPSGGDG